MLGVRPHRLRQWLMHGVAPSSALLTLAGRMDLRDGASMRRESDLAEAMELEALRN